MHELFANVLAKRDLSRAGELFSIEDEEIVDGLTDVVRAPITSTFSINFHNKCLAASRNINNNRAAAVPGDHQ